MTDFMGAAAAALERLAAVDAAAEAEYGRCVGRNMYERHEDGQLVSTLVVRGDHGTVAYQIIGVSHADLM